MNFNRFDLLLFVIPAFFIIFIGFLRQENKFFNWIKEYWFFSRSSANKVSSLLFLMGLFLLMISLADLRGKEEVIKGKVAEKKTLILIDSSASMLTEDVRPNRFQKALLLAKHYLKKAVGEQISIVAFSDKQKRIVPFTTDMNLIDARIGTLEELDLRAGGSNISQALKEAENYFRGSNGVGIGNILLLTDGEDNEDAFEVTLDDKITLATIGIGTAKGGTIPLRDNRGVSRGVKRFNGKPVTSKLDEAFLKKLGSNVKNYRYWIASSYSLPTEQIQNYFNSSYESKISEGEVRIKPVKYEYLIVPAFLLLILSSLLKLSKTFVYSCLLYFSLFNNVSFSQVPIGGRQGQENIEEGPQKSAEVIALEEKFAQGTISESEKKYLAQQLLKEGFPKESSTLYGELLKDVNPNNAQEFLNKGVADFQAGQVKEGIETYNKLLEYLEQNDRTGELANKVKKNLLKALQQVEQQQSRQSKDQEKQDKQNQDQQNQDQQNQDQQNQDQQNQDQQNQDQQNQNQQNKDQENQDQKEKEKNGKGDEDKKDKKDKEDKGKNKKDDKKDNESGDKGKKKKIPALLKQLISDDNQLQKEAIDAQTRDRKKRNRKDW